MRLSEQRSIGFRLILLKKQSIIKIKTLSVISVLMFVGDSKAFAISSFSYVMPYYYLNNNQELSYLFI